MYLSLHIIAFLPCHVLPQDMIAVADAAGSHIVMALRGGVAIEVAATDLVPGDVIALGEGDRVPADVRIVAIPSGEKLLNDRSALTGKINRWRMGRGTHLVHLHQASCVCTRGGRRHGLQVNRKACNCRPPTKHKLRFIHLMLSTCTSCASKAPTLRLLQLTPV